MSEPDLGSPWEDLRAYIALPRITSLDLSPDGSWLLTGIQTLSPDGTRYTTALWRVPTDGGAAHRLTRSVEGDQAVGIQPDGAVVFTSRRPVPQQDEDSDDKDEALWRLPAGGGEAEVIARRRGGFGKVTTTRTADRLVMAVGLRAGLDDLDEDSALRKARGDHKVRAILHEGAGVRYWDHDLHSTTIRFATLDDGQLRLATDDRGREVGEHFVASSDGSFVVTGVSRRLPGADRLDHLVRIDLATGESRDLLRDDHDGFEDGVLSDDDRWLACTRHVPSTPAEAPHNVLHLVDLTTGEHRDVAREWPRWATPVAFSSDASTLYVTADEDGEQPVFAIDLATDEVRRLTGHGAFGHVCLAPGGDALFAVRTAWDVPGEVVRIDAATGEVTALAAPVEYPELPGRLERIETTSPDGTRVPAWLCLPTGASADEPAPLALWVHGGPLNSWNAWSWRWCPWLLVSQGHAVLLPDPALSTGYGHAFVQRGWGAWGDATYTDLMAITDATVARPDIDGDRTCMMGGSFGGYMANWIAGHTDRFRCIVSHASLWNLETFGATTDSPWYWAREMTPAMRRANSPHLFADAITTPMLVIHGDKDYRVPIGEGLALWWALASGFDGPAEDLPHKFLYFPDENHWVLSPQHAVVWYETVRAFLETHVNGADFVRSDLL